jgi:Xaa-Pro aminopeptidase
MLTAAGCKTRRERLWQSLPSKPSCILLTETKHLAALANYWQPPFTFRTNEAGAALILTAAGQAILIGDNMLEMFLAHAHVDEVVAPVWYRSVESPPPRPAFLIDNVLKEISARNLILGADLDPDLGEQRQPNDPDEIELIRLSVKAGEAGMAAARREIKPGMTEMDLYWLVQQAACEAIGMQAIVYGDFVSGPNTEKGGGPPSQRKIESGDLILIDFSTVVWHYRADFAATFVCDGKPTSRQQELHHACVEAMTAGEKLLRPGISGSEVYQAVREAFTARQLAEFFPHHAGHGVGLSHPEAPFLVPQSKDTLLAGDVVTLEPGLYVPGVGGIRIERNYLLTESGFELLSKHSLELDQQA